MFLAVALLTVSCGSSSSSSAIRDGQAGNSTLQASPICNADVGLTAWAPLTAVGDVTVFGMVDAPPGVTVRAIYVAAQTVTLSAFNFRTWSVDVPAAAVDALVRAGQARIPVIAYTSAGCQALTTSEEPLVLFDGGVLTGLDAGSDGKRGPVDAQTDVVISGGATDARTSDGAFD
jgi:hypothetical protein